MASSSSNPSPKGNQRHEYYNKPKASLRDANPHGFKRNLSHWEDDLQSNFVESGWPALEFIGMCFNDDIEPRGSGMKVAIIDGSDDLDFFNQSSDYFNGFIRKPKCNNFCEKCSKETIVNRHGLYCGLIIAGKIHNTNWGVIRGVVPSAKIYFHTVSCTTCWNDACTVNKAIQSCMREKIHVISMSLAPRLVDEMQTSFIKTTLQAFERGIVICASVGNYGPSRQTTLYGMPWLVNVGACTSGKILTTYIYVAKKEEDDFSIVAEFEVPYNQLPKNKIFPLAIDGYLATYWEGHKCVMYHENDTDTMRVSQSKARFNLEKKEIPFIILHGEDAKVLFDWHSDNPELYIKISNSGFRDDERIFVSNFSSRGPSKLYKEIIMPDVVAPGTTIIPHLPEGISGSLTDEDIDTLYANGFIVEGTSFSNPVVAGVATHLLEMHPDWGPSTVKSALVTTAKSLAEYGAPGNEFDYGAGLIQPTEALNPGLVYEEEASPYQAYMKRKMTIDDLNLPSIVAAFRSSHNPIKRKFRRKVRFVGSENGGVYYTSRIRYFDKSLDPNVDIQVFPTQLEFEEKEVREFLVTATVAAHPFGYISALLEWHGDNLPTVRSPIHFYNEEEYEVITDED